MSNPTEPPKSPAHVEAQLIRLNRSFVTERRTGLRTMSATLRVVHELGEFELVVETPSWSDDKAALREMLCSRIHLMGEALSAMKPEDVSVEHGPPRETGQ